MKTGHTIFTLALLGILALASWSPDGSSSVFGSDRGGIAYESDQGGNSQMGPADLGSFTRITEGPHVNDGGASQGVSWVDYDNDSFPDLFISNNRYPSGQNNFLYHNERDGTFAKVTTGEIVTNGGRTRTGTWADYDNDGDVDCYIANWPSQVNFLFDNDGAGSFVRVSSGLLVTEQLGSPAASWADYDNDGRPDLFVANYGSNSLFHNDGDSFSKITEGEIATNSSESYGAAWADYDNDGDADLFVTTLGIGNNNYLYENNGNGTFSRITDQVVVLDGGESFGGSWGDYDNDGDLDLFVPNISSASAGNNFLYNNDGDGNFTSVSIGAIVNDGGYSFGSAWGDYDNDGDLDLFVANYIYGGIDVNFLYDNNGDGTFTRNLSETVATDVMGSMGTAWADYDRDGDIDLFIANMYNDNQDNAMYRNNGNSNSWINIRCIGTKSNRSALGAKVRLNASIAGTAVGQLREISGQTGYCGQSNLNAHFGLGDATIIDSIKIEWPSGFVDVLTDVTVDQFLTISEGASNDLDGDGFIESEDNCPFEYNPGQEDTDSNGVGDACCCLDLTGNVDGDPTDVCDIGDLTVLIGYLFIPPFTLPSCPAEGNIDGEGTTDIGDITALIGYLFIPPFNLPVTCE